MEASRSVKRDEAMLEYFAPKYIEVKRKGGEFVRTERPLLYNYVFIRSTEAEIYRRQRSTLHAYSFLPRVHSGGESHYPYLSDAEMRNLRWVAEAYRGELPVYVPESGRLVKGDRVRITEGEFKGVEAVVAVQPGAGHKDVVVCIEGCLWVPLMRVSAGQYEIIGLNESGKHVYTKLSNERIFQGLHKALRNYLLMAHTVLGNREERGELEAFSRTILPLLKAEQSRALLLATLYGCTDNNMYYHEAHALIVPWRREPDMKKSKRQLLQWLDDYDEWLGHRG